MAFTSVYAPKDQNKQYPILLCRTPYSCKPYGEDKFRAVIGPSKYAMEDGFIFVYQDVRGRYMSEGSYDNMRPHIAGDSAIDESSDTYDTIEWLLKNVNGNNGKVGMWGISYPGFYSAAALPEAHPALVAASPQAPIADFFFDDFHHGGAFTLMYWQITSVFGYQKNGPKQDRWYPFVQPDNADAYQFYLDLGPLKNSDKYHSKQHTFWQQITEHPNYDEFWQDRNLLPHLRNIHTAVLTVGGWFDAEDLYGPLQIYRSIEHNNPQATNSIVMGPWSHGDWARNREYQSVAQVDFGKNLSDQYQREIELPFFQRHLKGKVDGTVAEAHMFDTGKKKWQDFDSWPPDGAVKRPLFLAKLDDSKFGQLVEQLQNPKHGHSEFVSDPSKPVPYRANTELRGTPRPYMAEDQRFASERDDVLTFQTEVLTDDLTLAGPIAAKLKISTSKTASDWVVKVIDVYPQDTAPSPRYPGVDYGGFQQMVRSEALRGRFRESFSQPKAFVADEITDVTVQLQDVFHTFKKGHRLMVQVQSTWFPLIDRNPQNYVENIYLAEETDFVPANHRIYHSNDASSVLEISVLQEQP